MQTHILLGNIFSFCSALCLLSSAVKKSKKDFIGWQMGDDIFGCLTCLTLSSYSGLVVCMICFTRNLLAYKGKLTNYLTAILFFLNILIGVTVNNLGIIGYLPIIASASYTICVYTSKTAQQMRYALICNLSLWLIHCLYIQAYPSVVTNTIICSWTIFNAFKKTNINSPETKTQSNLNRRIKRVSI